MTINDGRGFIYSDECSRAEEPASPYVAIPAIQIKADVRRRMREYRAMITLEEYGKKVQGVAGGYALTAQELLNVVSGG